MDRQTRDARLTPREAKSQLLSLAQESGPLSLVQRYPVRALLVAVAAGLLFSKTTWLWRKAGGGGLWFLQQFLKPAAPPSVLDRVRARTYRRSLRR